MLPDTLKTKQPLATLAQMACDCLDMRDRLPGLDLTDIDSVSETFLDFLGWQYHVDEFLWDGTSAAKRKALKQSVDRHAYKGTALGVFRGLSALGFRSANIDTVWPEKTSDGSIPLNRFRVSLVNAQKLPVDRIAQAINENKSARAVLHSLEIRDRVDFQGYIVLGVRVSVRVRLGV